MIESALAILTASLLGSVHCAGMCGAFVCFYSNSSTAVAKPAHKAPSSTLHAHALYNVGRLISYVMLGALAGAFGSGITHASGLVGIANGAAMLAGVLMILWGLQRVAELRGVHVFGARFSAVSSTGLALAMQKFMGSVLLRFKAQSSGTRALLTGLLTTLLPCGWLYVFVVAAGGTGSAARGMALMALFWLGNVPALLAIGLGAQRALGPLQRALPVLSAVTITALGILAVFGHLNLASVGMHHAG